MSRSRYYPGKCWPKRTPRGTETRFNAAAGSSNKKAWRAFRNREKRLVLNREFTDWIEEQIDNWIDSL